MEDGAGKRPEICKCNRRRHQQALWDRRIKYQERNLNINHIRHRINIGTSGWHYKHWKGTYYPEDIQDKEQFDFYSKHFKTVEINNSFYRLPEATTFKAWRKDAPKGFKFAVKASRFITHMKKLKLDKRSLRLFFSRVQHLEEKLGPILFQLPPKWKLNLERFELFLENLPKGYRFVFEFREPSWNSEKVYALLKKHKCAYCIFELEHYLTPLIVTANFVYVRLHGPGNKYQGSYNTRQLKKWAAYCRDWQKEKKDVYIYFDNDQAGYAAFNAEKLLGLVGEDK
jgi:uncharacterized protein YecE (DUF72 family)